MEEAQLIVNVISCRKCRKPVVEVTANANCGHFMCMGCYKINRNFKCCDKAREWLELEISDEIPLIVSACFSLYNQLSEMGHHAVPNWPEPPKAASQMPTSPSSAPEVILIEPSVPSSAPPSYPSPTPDVILVDELPGPSPAPRTTTRPTQRKPPRPKKSSFKAANDSTVNASSMNGEVLNPRPTSRTRPKVKTLEESPLCQFSKHIQDLLKTLSHYSYTPVLKTLSPQKRQRSKTTSPQKVTPKKARASGRVPLNRRSSVVTPPPLRSRNSKGETPLHLAVRRNRLDEVTSLLDNGADPNGVDFAGWTPLHDSMSSGVDGAIVDVLLQRGARPDAHGFKSLTPLHMAEDSEKVRKLIEYGASPDAPDLFGKTARDIATPQNRQLLSELQLKPAPPPLPPPVTSVHLYKVPQQESASVRKFLKENGIKEEKDFFKASHIMCAKGDDLSAFDLKLLKVVSKGQLIISSKWTEDSANGLLPIDEYLREPGFMPGYSKAVNNSQLLRPGLFSGIHLYLNNGSGGGRRSIRLAVEELGGAKPIDTADLKSIMKEAGGVVLTREPDPESPNPPTTVPFHGNIKCNQYIVNTAPNPRCYRMEHIKSVNLEWLLGCLLNFDILPYNN